MFKRLMVIGLLSISLVVVLMSEAKAQYNYFGGGWNFCCSYSHTMTYTGVKGSDFNEFTILFVSNTVWYDNAQSCCVGKNCQNIPFEPGVGHVTLSGSVSPALNDLCEKRGKCTGIVEYPNSVTDLETNQALLEDCQAVVGVPNASPQLCFNLLFFGTPEGGHCRNKNDVVVDVRTKGVCTTATPYTCTDPDDFTTCTPENTPVGVRYTFPSFDQQQGDSFAQQRDDRCIACVAGTGPCTP
jgi:hypothetical protein